LADLPKGVKPATPEQLEALAAHADQFDQAPATYTVGGKVGKGGVEHKLASACRKAIEATITVPEPSEIIASPLLAAIIEERVKAYVKAQFVDKFLPVGAHDWATIEAAWVAAQEATGGGGFSACPYDDADFVAAQAVLDAYLGKTAPKLGAKATKLITGKATKRSVEAVLNASFGYSVATLTKLNERIVEACTATDNERTIEVLGWCAERIEKLIADLESQAVTDSDM
jgi:hypothetical protein